jgi:hypothetical protein
MGRPWAIDSCRKILKISAFSDTVFLPKNYENVGFSHLVWTKRQVIFADPVSISLVSRAGGETESPSIVCSWRALNRNYLSLLVFSYLRCALDPFSFYSSLNWSCGSSPTAQLPSRPAVEPAFEPPSSLSEAISAAAAASGTGMLRAANPKVVQAVEQLLQHLLQHLFCVQHTVRYRAVAKQRRQYWYVIEVSLLKSQM